MEITIYMFGGNLGLLLDIAITFWIWLFILGIVINIGMTIKLILPWS